MLIDKIVESEVYPKSHITHCVRSRIIDPVPASDRYNSAILFKFIRVFALLIYGIIMYQRNCCRRYKPVCSSEAQLFWRAIGPSANSALYRITILWRTVQPEAEVIKDAHAQWMTVRSELVPSADDNKAGRYHLCH